MNHQTSNETKALLQKLEVETLDREFYHPLPPAEVTVAVPVCRCGATKTRNVSRCARCGRFFGMAALLRFVFPKRFRLVAAHA